MSKIRVVLLTIVVALAIDHALPARAQLLLPFPTKKPKKTATPTPLATSTPPPTATTSPTPTQTALPQATRTTTPGPAATVTRTATPFPTATRSRTPTPVATSGAALPDMVAEIQNVQTVFGTSVASGDVAEGCAESTSGVDLLRFSALTKNVGTADLVLGDPQCPTPCSDHPLEVCGNPDYICSPAAGHNHPHYSNYARYELLDQSGTAVVVGHKQGYCLRDTNCAAPVYTCTNQGISAGCYDTYDYTLGCQYLDITGIPAGNYVLRVTIDPLQQIPEVSDDNNVTQQAVTIVRPTQATATPVQTATASRTATPAPTTTPARTATSMRTATPEPPATRTATPLRTATGAPPATPLPTSTPVTMPTASRSATPSPQPTASAPSTASPVPSPTAEPVDPDGALAAVCQHAILKAGRLLVSRTFIGLDQCHAAVAACETPRRRTASCRDRAADTCAQGSVRIADARATFVERVLARCQALGDDGMLARAGLAYARRADDCGGEPGDVAAIARCIGQQHVCRTGDLAETEEPSLGVRLGRGGMRAGELCIADLGGPDPNAPELALARALDGCSRAIHRAGRRFIRHRLTNLQSCLAAHASCLRATTGREVCEQRAGETCAARTDRLAIDPQRLVEAIDRACGGLDFTLVRSTAAGNLVALESRCAALGIPDLGTLAAYEECLARQHACDVDDLLRYQAPHSGEWVGAWPAPGGACPGAVD